MAKKMAHKLLMKVVGPPLHDGDPETGMGFQIVETQSGFIAVMENGEALPLYADNYHYDIRDWIAGTPLPLGRDDQSITVSSVLSSRAAALAALTAAGISPAYTGTAGAIPLIATVTLPMKTVFYRLLNSPADPRYNAATGNLTAGTYLTTLLDQTYANSGFAAVGRYALPLPIPASHRTQYELPAGTTILVGTVAPLFGQAGGGVEIQVPAA